ncbi:hypothetical protein, partial [Escherichia coli]|uniref:hypothetical protein n=1 Tax=Escherichia coli TaxID=562 RepID=UPI001BFD0049
VTTGIMKAFKFSFLLLSNEYFHVGQHDLLLLKNQVSSMITGIDVNYPPPGQAGDNVYAINGRSC